MEEPAQRIARELEAFSDRLGSHANADRWFDRLIDSWRTYDGVRNPALELEGLGEEIPMWVLNGDTQRVRGVLDELEHSLADEDVDQVAVNGFALEVLEGSRDQIVSLVEDGSDYESNRSRLEVLMGERTLRIWRELLAANS